MKKKPHWFEPYRKWVIGVILSVVIIPAISINWKHIQVLWAAPDKVEGLEKKVEKHETAQEALTRLLVEQSARIEKNEALDDMRAKNQAEQLALIAELKKDTK